MGFCRTGIVLKYLALEKLYGMAWPNTWLTELGIYLESCVYLCIAWIPDARLRSKMGDMGKDFLKIVYESTTNIRTKLKRNKSCRMFATLSLFDHNCQDAHRLSTTRTVNFTPPHLFPSFCRERNLSSILSRLWKLLTCLSFHFLLIIRHNLFGMPLRNWR